MPDQRLKELRIFSGTANPPLAESICASLGVPVGRARVQPFADTETHVRVEDDVRGLDCFVVQPTCHPVNQNLMELLIFIDCLHRASARRITAVLPYFGYARQDRKSEGRTPISAKLVANLITTARADRILAIDLHAQQVQGFFDIPVDHLTAEPVFTNYFRSQPLGDMVMVSPDVGNMKMANVYAQKLGGNLAVIDKRRQSGSEVVMSRIIGDVKHKDVLMFDDMISTAGTICSASALVKDHGARSVRVAATHGVFAGDALEKIQAAPIDEVVVTDTIPLSNEAREVGKIKVLSVANLLGEAMERIHLNRSVSEIFSRDRLESASDSDGEKA